MPLRILLACDGINRRVPQCPRSFRLATLAAPWLSKLRHRRRASAIYVVRIRRVLTGSVRDGGVWDIPLVSESTRSALSINRMKSPGTGGSVRGSRRARLKAGSRPWTASSGTCLHLDWSDGLSKVHATRSVASRQSASAAVG